MSDESQMSLSQAIEITEKVDDVQLQEAIKVIRDAEIDEVEARYVEIAADPGHAERLKKLGASFLDKEAFLPGELVVWKPDLKNRKRPHYDVPAVVVEVLDEGVRTEDSLEDYSLAEKLDLRLGFLIDTDRFVVYHFDSRRFTRFNFN